MQFQTATILLTVLTEAKKVRKWDYSRSNSLLLVYIYKTDTTPTLIIINQA